MQIMGEMVAVGNATVSANSSLADLTPLPTNDMDVTNVSVKEEQGDAEDAEKEVISLND